MMNNLDNFPAEHGEAIWRTICRLLGSDEGAADCFQETFVQFAQAARSKQVREPLALLKSIATSRAIDAIRRRRVNRRRQASLSDQQPGNSIEPWQTMAADELAENLRRALTQIPPNQATAFCMTQLEQMTRSQAASAMGITEEHAAVLLHRAREKLQGKLAKHLPAIERRS
jgi:RNA polymerase sigma-70 factor (ECF subfamily)